MSSATRFRLPFAVTLAAGVLLLAAGPSSAVAACSNAEEPGYKLAGKAARAATLCLLNKQRSSRGLHPLKQQKNQRKAAGMHTRTMLKRNCFAHICPGEGDLVARLSAANYLPCNCTWGIGENIAYGYGSESSPKAIVGAWLGSAPHRANILNPSFRHIGIGVRPGSPNGGPPGATYTTTFGFRR